MSISVFDLFKIGIGPSSSHTVGPMRAAYEFANSLRAAGRLQDVCSVKAELFGSLGATGKGHGSDKAVMLGLSGEQPDRVDPDAIEAKLDAIRANGRLPLIGERSIRFLEKQHLIFHRRKALPYHPNGMRFQALDQDDNEISAKGYYSVGGGFVVDEEVAGADRIREDETRLPRPFDSAVELLQLCAKHACSIGDIMLENEKAWRSQQEIHDGLWAIWEVMQSCVQRGCQNEGILPGGMQVKRRAASLFRELSSKPERGLRDPLTVLDWVNLYALAVNEENAAGGRVVTAPTNGAAASSQPFCTTTTGSAPTPATTTSSHFC